MKNNPSKINKVNKVNKIKSFFNNPTVKKVLRIINFCKNIFCWFMIILLALMVVFFLTSRVKGDTPTLFGYSVYRVSSGSMEPELMTGDVILDKVVDDASSLQVGDVITFDGTGKLDGLIVTHKVVVAPYTDENGELMLQTQGVANEVADEPISGDTVRAIMVCKIPYIDAIYNIFLSAWGLLIFILLLILIFIDEIINIVKILTGNDTSAEDTEDINTIIERLQKENQQSLNSGADSQKDE
jgi:signal peptidase